MHGKRLAIISSVFLAAAVAWSSPATFAQGQNRSDLARRLYNAEACARARRALEAGDVDTAMKGFCDMFAGNGDTPLWTVSAILLCDPSQLQNYVTSIEKLQPVFVQAKSLQGHWCYRICAGVTTDRKEAVRWRAFLPGALLAEGPFPVLITRPCEQPPERATTKAPTATEATGPTPSKMRPPPHEPSAPPAQSTITPNVSATKRAEGEAWFQKGLAAQGKEKRAEARECYQRSLEADPNRPEVLNNLGVLYLQENRYDKAKGLFDQALQGAPAYARAHLNLAGALWGMGDREGATMEARKAVLLDARDVSGHLTLASFLLAQDEKAQATEEAKRALLLEPDNAQAKALLAALTPPQGPGGKP